MEQKVLFIYLHSALLTPLPVIPVSTEEITDCNNEGAKGANKAGRNPPSCFLFHVSLLRELHQLILLINLDLK